MSDHAGYYAVSIPIDHLVYVGALQSSRAISLVSVPIICRNSASLPCRRCDKIMMRIYLQLALRCLPMHIFK